MIRFIPWLRSLRPARASLGAGDKLAAGFPLALSAAALLLLAGAAPVHVPRSEERRAWNPHGAADGCPACHAAPAQGGAGADQRVGPPLPIVENCRSCHPDADMHPVGMAPVDVHPHQGWPLEQGKVVCATCHVEPAHDPGDPTATVEPWLRGGPYRPESDLCYECHARAGYRRTDPHHPDTARDPAEPSCSACHTGRPERGAPPASARLRQEAGELCATCHQGQVHLGVESHVGAVPDPRMRAALPAGLVLSEGGAITCFTCHDVHGADPGEAAGQAPSEGEGSARSSGPAPGRRGAKLREDLHAAALTGDWAAIEGQALRWPGVDRGAHPALLALPLETLCTACHGVGPE